MKIIQSKPATELRTLRVTAMPYMNEGTYKPEWASSKAKNAAKLKVLMKTAVPYVTYTATGEDVVVFRTSDGTTDFLFVHGIVGDDPDLIQYGVRVIHYDVSGLKQFKACGQVSVWRNSGFSLTAKLPEWIFSNVLYPEYGHVVSDSTQSKRGKQFWERRIVEALQSGKKVYSIEIESEAGHRLKVIASTPVKSVSEMDKFYTTDQDYSGSFFRFLITK